MLWLFKNERIKQFVWALVLGYVGKEISAQATCIDSFVYSDFALSRVLSDCPGYWIKAPSWFTDQRIKIELKSLIMAQIERWRQA